MTAAVFPLSVMVNGTHHQMDVPPEALLLDVLHDRLGLTSTPWAGPDGASGACMVLVDDRPVAASVMLAFQVDGRRVETAEGLVQADPVARAVDRALKQHGVLRADCASALLVAATHALRVNPWINEDEAKAAILGVDCAAGEHGQGVAAILAAAAVVQTRQQVGE